MLLAALLYALGRYTPLYALAFEYVPGINLFRRPIDGDLRAGRGAWRSSPASCWPTTCARASRASRSGAVAVGRPGALGVIAWAVLFSGKTASRLGVAAGGAQGRCRWRSLRDRDAGARAHAAGARDGGGLRRADRDGELIWCNAASSLNAEAPAYYSVLQQPAGADAQALSVLERELADRHQQGERPRIEVVGVSGSWQNLAMARGLEATNGYNPLRIGSYDRLVSPGETTHIVDQRLFPASFDGYDCALARELGLEYVVLGRPIEEVPHLARRPVADVLLAGPKVWIYRLRRTPSRASSSSGA